MLLPVIPSPNNLVNCDMKSERSIRFLRRLGVSSSLASDRLDAGSRGASSRRIPTMKVEVHCLGSFELRGIVLETTARISSVGAVVVAFDLSALGHTDLT